MNLFAASSPQSVSATFNMKMMTIPLELTTQADTLHGQFLEAYGAAEGRVVLHAPHTRSAEATVTGGRFSLPQPQPGFYWLVLRTSAGLAQFGPLKID